MSGTAGIAALAADTDGTDGGPGDSSDPAGAFVDEHTLEVEVSKEQSLNEVFQKLTEQGIGVLSMRNKVNRLEELFMKLVEAKPAVRQ